MKRALLTHPKTLDLAARLGCSRPEAIGFLALLFDFCADHSPQGDIGKWPSGSIARACDWVGDPEAFVAALTDAKWLNIHELHGLLIHDWADNCDNWVRAKLKKKGLEFYSYDPSYEATQGALTIRYGVKGKGKGKEKTEPKKKTEIAFEFPPELDTEKFMSVWGEFITHRKELKKPVTPTSGKKSLASLEKMGHDIAIAAIEQTLEKGWQGIFPPTDSNGKPIKPKKELVYRDPNKR